MNIFAGKRIIKILKIALITISSLLFLLFIIPFFIPQTIGESIKNLTNKQIKGNLNFSEAHLSFFKHFPSLTLSLENVILKGSSPFENDTLIAAKEISFGIDLSTVFKDQVKINQIFLNKALINVQVDENGHANYNVYQAQVSSEAAEKDAASAALKIESIKIIKSNLVYNDKSLPLLLHARDLNYTGKGDFSQAIFDLTTQLNIQSLDFHYDGEPYLISKEIKAELLTKINTNSLAFIFERNNLMINKLPVRFKGKFEFLSNGYAMDFRLQSKNTDLHHLVTALPPDYNTWLNETKVKGNTNLTMALTGQYIAESKTMPGLSFKMDIRDGYIAHAKARPLENLHLDLEAKMPGLDPENISLKMDSLHFNIEKDYLDAVIHIEGFSKPVIYTRIDTKLDLQKWQQAIGLKGLELKGQYALKLLAEGQFAKSIVQRGIRKKDTVITSIPKFSLRSSFKNGYIKYVDLPKPIRDISFDINVSAANHQYQQVKFSLENFNASILNSYIKGFIKFGHSGNFAVDADIKSIFRLSDIKEAYPLDSISLEGDLNLDIKTKGNYIPAKKQFPVTTAQINLENGKLLTKYYPQPIEKIQVDAQITDKDGTFKTLQVNVKPISFEFESQPFFIKADLQNFENLKYQIASKGNIDLGKIYRVFAMKGLDINGQIQTNLALAGLQSDATSGNYQNLNNKGLLNIQNITIAADQFPKPFHIKTGKFRFNRNKMQFDVFKASYGNTLMEINGELNNVVNYFTAEGIPLKGSFDFKSNAVLVDEFMAFADQTQPVKSTEQEAATGVVLLPENLDFNFTASAKKVSYQGLDLDDFKGLLSLKNGKLELKETQFNLIGAPVTMEGGYASLNPHSAHFNYRIDVKDFNIKKAYNEIKIFRDMASAAAHAEGIVSLNYNLDGKLDANMIPVYPSLKGGGVLSVKQVKLKGLKLFNSVGDKTDHKDIKDPDLSKVDIKTTVANNIITLERTRMKVAGFRPRLEGHVNFDGQLNLSV
jgi:AsmA protein